MTSVADPAAPALLVLVGPMGAGKSSVGRRVAKALGVPFTDTDARVAAAHGPIPEIFAGPGEAQFRIWEREEVTQALQRGGVVALGGGAVTHDATRADLAAVPVVLLTVSARVVAGRLRRGARPLVAGDDPVAAWQRIADLRRALYAEVADVEFDTSQGPLTAIAQRVTAWAQGER